MIGQRNHLSNLKTVAVLLLLHTAFISCAPLNESAECVLDEDILVQLGFRYLRDTTLRVYPKLINEV